MAIIYSYPDATNVTSGNKIIGTQTDPTTEENKTVQFSIGQVAAFANTYTLGYSVYVAELSNFGDGAVAPTATILSNGIGAIIWTRNSLGVYTGTLSSAFTTSKCWASTQSQIVSNPAIGANGVNGVQDTNEWPGQQVVNFTSVDTVVISHFVLAQSGAATKSDNMKIFLEIRVYA